MVFSVLSFCSVLLCVASFLSTAPKFIALKLLN